MIGVRPPIRHLTTDRLACFACGQRTMGRAELPLSETALGPTSLDDGVLVPACPTHMRDYRALLEEAGRVRERGWVRCTAHQTTIVSEVPKPVIFLQAEGVLSSGEYLAKRRKRGLPIVSIEDALNRVLVGRVERLARQSRADIVIVSAWLQGRPLFAVRQALRHRGLTAFVREMLPAFRTADPSEQILAWLLHHPRCTRWVALHCVPLAPAVAHGQVTCDPATGITDANVRAAFGVLRPSRAERKAT